MIPSPKEQQCLAFSRAIRERIIEKQIEKINSERAHWFLSPKMYKKTFVKDIFSNEKRLPFWTAIMAYCLLIILYFILVPLSFIMCILEYYSKENNPSLKRKRIREKYAISDSVSERKSFEVLWNEKGLRNWGFDFMDLHGVSQEDQLACLRFWFMTLYSKSEADFETLYTDIKNECLERRKKFYQNYPGGHLQLYRIPSLLPETIANRFGDYVP